MPQDAFTAFAPTDAAARTTPKSQLEAAADRAASAVETISDGLMNRARNFGLALQRRKREHDFGLFRRRALSFFQDPPASAGHDRMATRSGYTVTIGEGDAPERLVEIAYGAHELRSYEGLRAERLRLEWRATRELGAALLYAQGDDGAVSVFMYPARTDGLAPAEDGVVLARYANLEPLTGQGALERHWRALRAYAESTSVDGEPSISDQIRMVWLRATRPLIRNGRVAAPEWVGLALSAGAFAVAVAAAALLVGAAG